MAKELTDANFAQEVIAENELPVLVDFWGPSCGPCNRLAPLIDTLAEKTEGFAKVFKINANENPESASEYNVRGLPTVIIFYKGSETARFMGVQHPKHYLDALGLEY